MLAGYIPQLFLTHLTVIGTKFGSSDGRIVNAEIFSGAPGGRLSSECGAVLDAFTLPAPTATTLSVHASAKRIHKTDDFGRFARSRRFDLLA
jgi:hypothetical protein